VPVDPAQRRGLGGRARKVDREGLLQPVVGLARASFTVMKLGFIGAGNMASALARGIGEPVVACDVVAGKAEALVEAVGGEVVETPQQVAEQSDAIVLAHKPGQLEDVAGQLNGTAKVVVSILGGVPTTKLEAAYPGA